MINMSALYYFWGVKAQVSAFLSEVINAVTFINKIRIEMIKIISIFCYVIAMYTILLLPSSSTPLRGLALYSFLAMFGAVIVVDSGAVSGLAFGWIILVTNRIAATSIFILWLVLCWNYTQQTQPPFPLPFHRMWRTQLILTLVPLVIICFYILVWKYYYNLPGLPDFITSYIPQRKLPGVFIFIWYMNLQTGLYGVIHMLFREKYSRPGWYAGLTKSGKPIYTDQVSKIVCLNHFYLLLYLYLISLFPI